MTLLRSRALTVVALALASAMPARLTAEPAVRWIATGGDAARAVVEVGGLDAEAVDYLKGAFLTSAEWRWVLTVHADPAGRIDATLPAMAGKYHLSENALRFEPEFPLAAGVHYRAVFRPAQAPAVGDDSLVAHFEFAASDRRPSTVVAQVFPSSATLPENLLKLYLHFSAPMSRGRIYEHIHLLEESGKAVDLPFLELDEELWNPAMTRLTLIIDPGRIKRGVKPLEDFGPALEAGKRYRLVVDPAWKDAAGKPLARGFEKVFAVGPADREPPDPAQWQIARPTAASRDELVVRFPKPLDQAITERLLRVTDAGGIPFAGTAKLSEGECRWSFTPTAPWPRGRMLLVVPATLEDLAGNNIGKLFDVDLLEPVQPRLTNASLRLPIEVR